ncbi:MAG: hypothetical protein KDJ15_07075 [Alphaproteobacteria bacterium]|nr:hypothetical protein [Alphaproteobacteria bacterium]
MPESQFEIYQEARSLLIRARLYRYCAVAFTFTGLAVFIFIYFHNVEGYLLEALTRPTVLAAIFTPFLPAIVLSLMASQMERRFRRFLDKHKHPPPS